MWKTPKTDWRPSDTLDVRMDLTRISANLNYLIEAVGQKGIILVNTLITEAFNLNDVNSIPLTSADKHLLVADSYWEYASLIYAERIRNLVHVITEINTYFNVGLTDMNIKAYINHEILNAIEENTLRLYYKIVKP